MNPFDPSFADTSKCVYHYTKMETAQVHILPSRSLRFGRYCGTNDPKESKTWQFDFWTRGDDDLIAKASTKLKDELSCALKDRTHVLCFCMDSAPLKGSHLEDIHKRGFAKPRMWAQYGGNHTGVCLIFDKIKLGQRIAEQCGKFLVAKGVVNYADRAIVPQFGPSPYTIDLDILKDLGFDRYVRWHLEQNVQYLFFEKMTDWRAEVEFRWIVFSTSPEDVFINFGDSLIGVVFGDNAEESKIDAVIELTEDPQIAHVGLKWKNCSPWYDYGNLRYSRGFRRIRRMERDSGMLTA